jgi:hypothetical protein
MDDLNFLPEELRARSINDQEIILNYEDVRQAIDLLEAANWALLGWEGCLHYPDGHIGFAWQWEDIDREEGEMWDAYVRRSAAICRATIGEAQQRWTDQPERTDAELFYCLTASDGTEIL